MNLFLHFRENPPLHGERRVCRFAAAPDPSELLKQRTEVLGRKSGVIADALQEAQRVPAAERGPDYAKNLPNESEWRNAWSDPNTYLAAFNANNVIDDPQSFLLRLNPVERKELLVKYLQERFPKTAKAGNADFNLIVAAVDITAVPVTNVRAFLRMGAVMRNDDVDANTAADAAVNARVAALNTGAKEELQQRMSGSVVQDELKAAMVRHPEIGVATLANPDAVKRILIADKDQGYLAAALRMDVIADGDFRLFCSVTAEAMANRQNTTQAVVKKETAMKNVLQAGQERGIMEKVAENWSNMEGWQKFAVAGIGIYVGYKWIKKVLEKGPGMGDIFVGLPLLFYITGGRKLVEGTSFGNMLAQGEKKVNEGLNWMVGATTTVPDIKPERAEMYSRYFTEVAGVEVRDELEAMEYLSMIPMGDVANSLTLGTGGISGELDLRDESPVVRQIRKHFGEDVAERVLPKMRHSKTGLGDALPRVFYMMGATTMPAEHRKIEEKKNATTHKSYEELSDADKTAYRAIVEAGKTQASTTYAGMPWHQVIGILLEKGSKR